MIAELRVQERQPCRWERTHCGTMPEYATRMGRCVGCAGGGTRWVVVGTLVPRGTTVVPSATSNGYEHESRYVIEPVGNPGAHDPA